MTQSIYRKRETQQQVQSVKLSLDEWVIIVGALVFRNPDLAEQIACTVGLERVPHEHLVQGDQQEVSK